MSLIVENGTVVAGAESYLAVTDADTYHANRGSAAWAALTTTAKEQALRQATDYMVEVYRHAWTGYRFTATQALDWPRSYVPIPDAVSGYGPYEAMVAPNIVPTEVKNACAILALKASAGDLMPDLAQNKIRQKIGPLEVEYDRYSPQTKRYLSVDQLLAPYLTGSRSMSRLART